MTPKITRQGLANKQRKIIRDVEKINEARAQVREMESTEDYTYFHFDRYRNVTFQLSQMEFKLKSYVLDYLKFYHVSEERFNAWRNYSLAEILNVFNIYTRYKFYVTLD